MQSVDSGVFNPYLYYRIRVLVLVHTWPIKNDSDKASIELFWQLHNDRMKQNCLQGVLSQGIF